MKTIKLIYKINIASNQETIFEYLSDWEKQSDWILFTRVEKLSNTPNKKGTVLVAITKFGKLKFVDTMIVTEWMPNEKIAVTHTGRVILGKGIFKIQKITENSCQFVWEEVTPVPFGFIGKIGLLLVNPLMKLLFSMSLKKLKRNIELTN